MGTSPLTIGLLTSIGCTLDAFFVPIVQRWRTHHQLVVKPASGTLPEQMDGTEIIEGLTRQPSEKAFAAIPNLRKWVKRNDLDVVITNTATASGLARLSNLPVPVIYFCHGLHWNGHGPKTWLPQIAEWWLASRTAAVICINSDDEEWFAKHSRNTPQLRLVSGVGLDASRFRRTPRPYNDVLRLVWIGEFIERKNPLGVLGVARHLVELGVDFALEMLGEGPLRKEAAARLAAEGLAERVRLPGRVDPVQHLEAADVVIHTARWEGLPRVLLEAVAVGRPVVAYDVKGVRDVPGAILVREGDAAALAVAARDAAIDGSIAFPDPATLHYEPVADAIAEFAAGIARGRLAGPETRLVGMARAARRLAQGPLEPVARRSPFALQSRVP
ncbi:MAG: glycosyltransferase [Deltaproteobacteria bacterium]|nr:glycosyltransferase [Deltaproteobacteria bacterium]